MNIQLPDPKQFNFKDCVIAGDECVLITPKDMGVDWNDENKYFRSSIWRKSDKFPISLSFKKFVNYGEKPDFEPIDKNFKFTAIKKIDGSCLIVSKYKGELIIRTRGTVDATKLKNGYEIAHLILKYPKAFNNEYLNSENCTLLFEWTTPTNRIVLNETSEPTLWLIGLVIHTNDWDLDDFYWYSSQSNLDFIANDLEVKRPETFEFNIKDIDLLKKQIEPLKDIEGVVIYDGSGQILKKIKTLRYLQLHRVFTGVKTVDHLFDLFIEYGCTERENFEGLLATNFDWELVVSLKELIDELYLKWKRIITQLNWIQLYFNNPDFIQLDRKGKAQKILEIFPNCSGIAFAMLDNKEITPHKLWNTFNG
jgi:hypothetical protein